MRTSLSLVLVAILALVCTVGCNSNSTLFNSGCSGGKCRSPINVEAK